MSTEEQLPEGLVGSVSYTNRQYETFKMKPADDAFQFRVIPPVWPTLKKRRDVGLYWKTHFGWKGMDERGRERIRPFLCIEDKRDGRITQVCDACVLRKTYEDKKMSLFGKKRDIETFGAANKKTAAQIRAAVKPIEDELKDVGEWLYGHGLDGKFRVPVINRQGKLGLFLMPYGMMKKFRERLRELNQKMGLDPCGVKGVWFEATRNGKASRDSDDVQPVSIFNKEDGSSRLDFHTMDNATILQASQSIPDLGDLMEKGRVTEEQITALVNCSGDPEEVDKILGIEKTNEGEGDYEPATASSAPSPVGDDSFGGASASDAFSKPEPEETPVEKPAEAAAGVEDDEEAELAALQAKIAAKKAAKASAEAEKLKQSEPKPEVKTAAKAKASPKTAPKPAVDAAEAPAEDFEAMLND